MRPPRLGIQNAIAWYATTAAVACVAGAPYAIRGAGEATFEHAEAARGRNQVGEVADQVPEDERGRRQWVASGGEYCAQRGDVEAEVAERAEQPPAWPQERPAGAADSG